MSFDELEAMLELLGSLFFSGRTGVLILLLVGAAVIAVAVSPWTTTQSGRSASMTLPSPVSKAAVSASSD